MAHSPSFFFFIFIFIFFMAAAAPSANAELIKPSPLILNYHNGPVLSGPESINIYTLFYGSFSKSEKSTIRSFFNSFSNSHINTNTNTVAKWWSLTSKYLDAQGDGVSQSLQVAGEITDRKYSMGKSLKKSDIAALLLKSLKSKAFTSNPKSIYLILTADDVTVEGFCQNTCGEHLYTFPGSNTDGVMLPYAWVGNSMKQCPGFCAWPYAKSQYGSQAAAPLKAPNGVGVDGMIITIAKLLAGAATNPFGTAYYQGDQTLALEAAGACSSSYGPNAYPGYPGNLLKDSVTGDSYNVVGANGRKFLVPWMWNPDTLTCSGQP